MASRFHELISVWGRRALFLSMMSLVAGCTRLDTSGAVRCEIHSDCNPGRRCQDGRCVKVTDEPDSAGEKPSATAGTGGTKETGGAGTRAEMDGGMDSSMAPPDTGTGSGGNMEGGAGTAGKAGASGSTVGPPDAGDDDADSDLDDDDGGEDMLPFAESHPCGRRVRNFDALALWLSSAYGVQHDDEQRVALWQDQSIHGHAALPVGDEPHWPVLTTPPEVGRPGVQFGPTGATTDARRLRIADHSSLQFAGDFAIIAVLRYRNTLALTPGLTGAIYTKLCGNCSDARGVGVFANDSWGLFTDHSPSRSGFTVQLGFYSDTFARTPQVGFNDNALHIVVARRLGTSLSIAADRRANAGVVNVGALDVTTSDWDVIIGANPGGADQILDGELFELIAVAGPDALDVDMLVDCLATSYAIPEL